MAKYHERRQSSTTRNGREIAKRFSVEIGSEKENSARQDIVVRPASQPQTLETGIVNFLEDLGAYGDTIRQSAGILRIGVFYDLDETVVFPLRLSAGVVKALGALNLAVDATGYPCKETEGD